MTENVKQSIISYLETLPNDITIEDIMYHLYVREKIMKGIADADTEKAYSNDEMKELIEKWKT